MCIKSFFGDGSFLISAFVDLSDFISDYIAFVIRINKFIILDNELDL